jgi:hypothetical protein
VLGDVQLLGNLTQLADQLAVQLYNVIHRKREVIG